MITGRLLRRLVIMSVGSSYWISSYAGHHLKYTPLSSILKTIKWFKNDQSTAQ